MIDFSDFTSFINSTALKDRSDYLLNRVSANLSGNAHGEITKWNSVLRTLPEIEADQLSFDQDTVKIGTSSATGSAEINAVERGLRQLHPWRKGPFSVFDIFIDTEWRSDWKWNRLKDHIKPLEGRHVLDVGCGNGYHCFRMLGIGAESVTGIDPYLKSIYQFYALKKFCGKIPVYLLPLTSEEFPQSINFFDTVFSMGVLYHRRSPFDHLFELKGFLRSGGQLILETLIIEGRENEVLVPAGRYAKMRNVWFIPTVDLLKIWLRKSGFKNIRVANVCKTTIDEQRSTGWMTFESLPQFLKPGDQNRTVEGHPAPARAILIAEK